MGNRKKNRARRLIIFFRRKASLEKTGKGRPPHFFIRKESLEGGGGSRKTGIP